MTISCNGILQVGEVQSTSLWVTLRKLQSLLPKKFSGIDAATASAWAGSLAKPAPSTSPVSSSRLKPSAARLTTKKRIAWKWARPARASNVQWRFSTKLLITATSHASDVRRAVVDLRVVHAQGVHDQVDRKAHTTHQAEPDELQPVRRLAHPMQEANVRADLHGGRLVAHPSQGSGTTGRMLPLALSP